VEKKTFQREQNLIFDFFLQKKNQKSNFALSTPSGGVTFSTHLICSSTTFQSNFLFELGTKELEGR
jgi:hypothetical protein